MSSSTSLLKGYSTKYLHIGTLFATYKGTVQEVFPVRQSLSSYEECFSIFAQRRKDFEKKLSVFARELKRNSS
jgi:hypothetical protein